MLFANNNDRITGYRGAITPPIPLTKTTFQEVEMADSIICKIKGCSNNSKARGWCSMHWTRWKRHGDPLYIKYFVKKTCSVDACNRHTSGLGYCSMHYQRLKNNGSPHVSKYEKWHKSEYCNVDGCGNKRIVKGMCQKHYLRVKNNGGVKAFNPRYKRMISWLKAHASHDGDECLIWPFSINDRGRGIANINGKSTSAPRIMCMIAHGEPPTDTHQAAHYCGNGHKGCVNPKHIRWATAKENEFDKRGHGTLRRGTAINTSKLSECDVTKIRAIGKSMT